MSPSEMFVTMADLRKAKSLYGGYCLPGIRQMAEFHGVDYKKLIRGQVTVAELEALNDFLVTRVAALARRRIESETENVE